MRKKLNKSIIITERDEKLFRYLFVNKVATNHHLKDDIFDGASKQAVHRRLDKLSHEGFIEVSYLRGNGNRLVYSLGKKALHRFIGDRTQLKRMQRKSSSISHDLGLLEIKRALLGFQSVANYLTENVLQAGLFDDESDIREIRKINPDAIVKVSMQENIFHFPLEYEASAKFANRYDKLLARYYLMDEVKAVLFISKTASIQKKVMQAEKKRCKKRAPKFFYCLFDEFTHLGEKASFTNIQKEALLMN